MHCGYAPAREIPRTFINELIVEIPQVYSQRKWVGDPNDLIDVAVQAGVVVGGLSAGTFQYVRPSEWKGQTPKAIHHRRVEAALTARELEVWVRDRARVPASLRHNIFDSIGLGLWQLGRMK